MAMTYWYNNSMEKQIKNIIFDVDGTIADCTHRRHFVEQSPQDWKSFKETTIDDTPVQWVCDIAKRFVAQGERVIFFSARNETERAVTEQQIRDWIGIESPDLFLRKNDDFRSDEVFKSEIADMFEEHVGKIDMVFDDRNSVVEMWRQRGLNVIQVADGDF